ncbi:hypothetical protein AB0442_03000 [Kitasatospora sp. NPDC085895]|uniref:hypothetical protein n=1 Tax=Kitasatospora sp. NPDC085895 TaxID=3155057 RepID=UPI00344D3249
MALLVRPAAHPAARRGPAMGPGQLPDAVAEARHPHADADLLERLPADPEPQVADDAAAGPALPRDRMECILVAAGL